MKNYTIVIIAILFLIVIGYLITRSPKSNTLVVEKQPKKVDIFSFIKDSSEGAEDILNKFTGTPPAEELDKDEVSPKVEPIVAGSPEVVSPEDKTEEVTTVSAVNDENIGDIIGYPQGSTQTQVS